MKLSNKSISGTSYHGYTIRCTPKQLLQVFFKLDKRQGTIDDGSYHYGYSNTGKDKVNLEFKFETSEGYVFTVYDWKEYTKLDDEIHYDFNIGGASAEITRMAQQELADELKEIPGSFILKNDMGVRIANYNKAEEEEFSKIDLEQFTDEDYLRTMEHVEALNNPNFEWDQDAAICFAEFYANKYKSEFGKYLGEKLCKKTISKKAKMTIFNKFYKSFIVA
jgi:major membrane immunogen (membrane-anchored lipoprotein)